ncbi:cupredoxin domain-containing protein [Candidatus Microgenomates bacterium]|nr:cupredoxin domain-containing protein [Candidatus Microgenomates bacterium]
MRKFTLIFVLLVLTASFVVVFLYFASSKKTLIPNQTGTQTSVEDIQKYNGVDMGPSVYEDYTAEAYDEALKEGRVVFLYFTANWCPICREQEPINREVFENLSKVGVVGLRVHILDSETTDETESLAKKFDVNYQHTYVILDSLGAVNYKYTGPLEKSVIIEKILDVTKSIQQGEDNKSDVVKIEVVAQEFSFTLPETEILQGQEIELTLKNEGKMIHDLVIDELGVTTSNVLPGESVVINFTVPENIGSLDYYCSIGNHKFLGMSGSIEVR